MSKRLFEDYTEVTNYKLLQKVPIVIHINGRGFRKVTSLLEKPFSFELLKCFETALFKTVAELEGCVFGYHFNDEFIFILRNDQHKDTLPWYDNRLQRINSVAVSILTYNFGLASGASDLSLAGDPIFINQVFNFPKILDCANYLVFNQNKNYVHSLNLACEYELLKLNFNRDHILEMIKGMSIDEKKDLLFNTCNKDYLDYPNEYRRGIASYKVKINDKNRWILNTDIGIFSENIPWLLNILSA
jgi:tRNA(His) 5'-end guanylyltransferase